MENQSVASETIEDYLQTIYSLQTEGERVFSARLARWMNVTQATVSATIKRMQRDGLITLDEKKGIHFTDYGLVMAESVARRHRLSERFLSEVLGLGWADAHEQAHHFEHGITPVIEEKLLALLNYPTTCPHGSPIPGTGAVLNPDLVALDDLNAGDTVTVEFISEELEEDGELLHYLEQNNVKPGEKITIEGAARSSDVINVITSTGSVPLGIRVAHKIRALK